MGEKGEGFSRTCIKDTWTKPKVGRIKGGKWGWLGWRERRGEMDTTVLEQQLKEKILFLKYILLWLLILILIFFERLK